MAQLFGAHTQGRWGQTSKGVGTPSIPVHGSWACVSGSAGEVVVYSITQIQFSSPEVGCYLQATGSVTVEYTLQNPAIATSREPGMASSTKWTAPQSLSAGAIAASDSPAWTAIRITFTEDADLMIFII